MGAAVAAPLGCLSSCAGGCLAACCCKLATAGSTDTNKGARCVLFWLQVIAVAMAALMTWKPKAWLDWPCGKLPDLGICECYGLNDETSCYTDQLIYRTESSAVVVFLFLLIMCVSGCAKHAAKSFPVGKFIILILLIVVTMFIPNASMSLFGSIAGILSGIYLVAQMVIVIDFGYTWNEDWMIKSKKRLLEQPGGTRIVTDYERGHAGLPATPWSYGILISATLLLIGSIVVTILLCLTFKVGGAIVIAVVTLIVSLFLLYISISEWCEHGNLLASSVVTFYSMWLVYEALAVMPDTSATKLLPWWVSLVICAVSLVAFAYGSSSKSSAEQEQSTDLETTLHQQEGGDDEQDDVPKDLDTWDFTKQCLVHATAAVYIASCLAPSKNSGNFTARVVVLIVAVALYGWTLIAPKVLKNRQF